VSPEEQAERLFAEGRNCAQAVLAAFAPAAGLDEQVALRVAAALGGGVCRTGATCSAVTGALMAIGLLLFDPSDAGREAQARVYAAGALFMERFAPEHGARDCRTLLGEDMGSPEGRQRAREAGLFRERCPRFVRDAARLVQEVLR